MVLSVAVFHSLVMMLSSSVIIFVSLCEHHCTADGLPDILTGQARACDLGHIQDLIVVDCVMVRWYSAEKHHAICQEALNIRTRHAIAGSIMDEPDDIMVSVRFG